MQQLLSYFEYKPNILLPIFAFFTVIFPPIGQAAIALYLILWLYHRQYKSLSSIKNNWFLLLSVAYFGVFALSGLYSENLSYWGRDLEAKLPLLIVPIVLLANTNINKKVILISFWSLAVGCVLFAIYVHYKQLSDYIALRGIVGRYTHMNVIYYTMYVSMVLFFLLFDLITSKDPKSKRLYIIAIGIFHYILFAFASRMAIISTTVIEIASIFIWKIIFEKKFLTGIGWIMLILVINSFSLTITNSARTRFKRLMGEKNVRTYIWQATTSEIEKSPIIGYGAGDTRDVLRSAYLAMNFQKGVKQNLNSHNQYLESWLSTGILGLLIIISWLVVAFIKGWRKGNYLFCIFITIIALNLLTESMFERQQGTYFMAFFGSLLLWNDQKED